MGFRAWKSCLVHCIMEYQSFCCKVSKNGGLSPNIKLFGSETLLSVMASNVCLQMYSGVKYQVYRIIQNIGKHILAGLMFGLADELYIINTQANA